MDCEESHENSRRRALFKRMLATKPAPAELTRLLYIGKIG